MKDDKDWDPEKELDPDKIQREYFELAKEMVDQMKEAKAQKAAEAEAMAEAVVPSSEAFAYRPPTFAQISGKLKKCWEETKRIAPDAPEFVQAELIRYLLQAPIDPTEAP